MSILLFRIRIPTVHCTMLFLTSSRSLQASTDVHILDTACLLGQSNDYQRQPLQLTAGSSDILSSSSRIFASPKQELNNEPAT